MCWKCVYCGRIVTIIDPSTKACPDCRINGCYVSCKGACNDDI